MRYFSAAFMLVLVVLMPASLTAQSCDSLRLEITHEREFYNCDWYSKYTVEGYWELTGMEGNGDDGCIIFPLAEQCYCLCDSVGCAAIFFPGEDYRSESFYLKDRREYAAASSNSFSCDGYSGVTDDDVIIFEVSSENIDSGSGTWYFYSTLGPREVAGESSILTVGDLVFTGEMAGVLPDCFNCSLLEADSNSWGAVKRLYR